MQHDKNNFRIFLCGDVMTGRGIDQILPHPNKPHLYESFVQDARVYVVLAEKVNGKISYPVSLDYIWGDALTIWQQFQPDVKIINLETAITRNEKYQPKGINYRMHPDNIGVLKAAGINICCLANNHILDWDYLGLRETLETLKESAIQFSGTGENLIQAMQPAIFKLSHDKRILVFSGGTLSSGVPESWAATAQETPGIYYIPDLSQNTLAAISKNINRHKKPGDLVVFSIHWGSNWGYEIPEPFRIFAHGLIDSANIDIVFGHSSHHPRPIEIYKGKPIFYGCGDFINDYEGITGYEKYRSDLSLMYFLDFDVKSLQLKKIILVPLQIRQFRLNSASQIDCEWLRSTLNQSAKFATQFTLLDNTLVYLN